MTLQNFKRTAVCLCLSLFAFSAAADSVQKLAERSQTAATVLSEIVNAPDKTIPLSLLQKSVCVATIPNVVRAGFVFGGKFGKGLVSCRVAGGWSTPSFLTLSGGSWGLQIGVNSTDLILIFVRANAMERLSTSNFTMGADASVAAGPVGRDAQIGTDYQLKSEIYAYARSRGLFAGLTLDGSLMKVDEDSNAQMYGRNTSARGVLSAQSRNAPTAVWPYIKALETYIPN